jgi:hypothetical protein
MGLRGHILTQPREIGAISSTAERRKELASKSRSWLCPICGVKHADLVPLEEREDYNPNDAQQPHRVPNAPGILVLGDSKGKGDKGGKQLRLEDLDGTFEDELIALRKRLRRFHLAALKKRQALLKRLQLVVFVVTFLLTLWYRFFMTPHQLESRTIYSTY